MSICESERLFLQNEVYLCPGPQHSSGEAVGRKGVRMNYRRCLMYADCSCSRYLLQCDRIDELFAE
jgi:hypothetical protein